MVSIYLRTHTHAPCLVQHHGPVSEADTAPRRSWEIASMSGPHKGIHSVACMLDLCRVSALLCAPHHQSDLRSQRGPEVKSRCLHLILPQLGYPSKSALKFAPF